MADANEATLAYVVSRRPFIGSWEYLVDQAIYTSPPTLNWSGAALIGKDGKLLGVGSLILRDATEADPHLPGNMFVPIDLLKPILSEMVRTGHRSGPARPWLGVVADEVQGRLIVTRVSPDSPAEQAGLQVGRHHPGGRQRCRALRRRSSTARYGGAARRAATFR